MKEMRLFEVGYKLDQRDGGYYEKIYVGADHARAAEETGKAYLMAKHHDWWHTGGKDDVLRDEMRDAKTSDEAEEKASAFYEEEMERLKDLCVGKVIDLGTLATT